MLDLLKHTARPLVLSFGLAVVATVGCGQQAQHESKGTRPVAAATSGNGASASKVEQTVALEIDFGNGRKVAASAPWREGLTAMDALVEAKTDKPLKIERRGTGETTLVEAIDGVHNGTDQSQRNWMVKVNGKLSQQSAAVTPVKPGDRVLWEYATWE